MTDRATPDQLPEPHDVQPAPPDPGRGDSGAEPREADAEAGAASQRIGSWGVLALVAVLIVGVMSGTVATLLHRVVALDLPAGLVGALAIAAVSGMLARAAADFGGVLVNAAALLVAILALTYLGSGTNVVVADDTTSLILLLGVPVLAVLVPSLTPRSWYRDA